MIQRRLPPTLRGMKWVGYVALLVAPWAWAQTPPAYYFQDSGTKPQDLLKKKSGLEGKMFQQKTFDGKSLATKELPAKQFDAKAFRSNSFETKTAPGKEFPSQMSSLGNKEFETKQAVLPTAGPAPWWKRIFGIKRAPQNDKAFPVATVPTPLNSDLQQKIENREKLKTLELPKIKPTREEINKLK